MTAPRTPSAPRGFTLLELLVTTAIGGIVLIGVMGSLVSTQKHYVERAGTAEMQSNLRTAMSQIELAVARAGYGIDPNIAVLPELPDATNAYVMMDGVGPFESDNLIVLYRDPLFRRVVPPGSVPSLSFTLSPALAAGDTLYPGHILLLLCESSQENAYVRVSAYSSGTVTLSGTAGPLNQIAKLTPLSCFDRENVVVTRVEVRQFFIAWLKDPLQGGNRPALMVNRWLDLNANNTAGEMPNGYETPGSTSIGDTELVALDIEQLQVAYVMHKPNTCPSFLRPDGTTGPDPDCVDLEQTYGLTTGPDGDGNFVFGDQADGTKEVPLTGDRDAVWSGTTTAPTIKRPPYLEEFAQCAALTRDDPNYCGYGSKRRFTGHSGNIRAIRITLAGRSSQRMNDPSFTETSAFNPEGTDIPMENLLKSEVDLAAAKSRHYRQRLQTTVTLKNMFQRRHFLPPVDASTPGMNIDGG